MTQDFSDAIRPAGKNTLIDITVTPNAKSTGIKGFDPWRKRIIVKVKERPLQNRANLEIIGLFSKIFGAEVKIVSGQKSSQKTVEATILADEAVRMLYEQSKI